MAIKTYVLLDHTRPTAPVYLQVNATQRQRLDTRPVDHSFMQVTFTDREGKNRTIRLKLSTNKIYQDEQIKDGILANEKFTQAEKDSVRFQNGVLTTGNLTVQAFLEASPQNEDFWKPLPDDTEKKVGYCVDIQQPMYRLFDNTKEKISDNEMFKKRLKAANKINDLDLEASQALMIRLNGSFFKAPDNLLDCQLGLVAFLDDANEAALDDLIRDTITVDEKVTVLIGKAIKAGVISFDAVPNQVVKMVGDKKVNLKEVSSEYDPEERKRIFAEFLISKDGELLLNDLNKDVKDSGKKK